MWGKLKALAAQGPLHPKGPRRWMDDSVDDKSAVCLAFILEQWRRHQGKHAQYENLPPFILGVNGAQGVGKSTLVAGLAQTLTSAPYCLSVVVLSIDDLYLPHSDQVALAKSQPDNSMVQHRGVPSTHDISLGISVFSGLRSGLPTRIPQYDKSKFNGLGDRVPELQWETVNVDESLKVQIVIFEGWCVGFRALGKDSVRNKWEDAVIEFTQRGYTGRLGWTRLQDVQYVDHSLESYDGLTDQLNALIHIDAEDLQYVYDWRRESERRLRAKKGSGMTDEQVREFVNGYFPSYELYTERLRAGIFQEHGKQLRLIVGKDRKTRRTFQL